MISVCINIGYFKFCTSQRDLEIYSLLGEPVSLAGWHSNRYDTFLNNQCTEKVMANLQ